MIYSMFFLRKRLVVQIHVCECKCCTQSTTQRNPKMCPNVVYCVLTSDTCMCLMSCLTHEVTALCVECYKCTITSNRLLKSCHSNQNFPSILHDPYMYAQLIWILNNVCISRFREKNFQYIKGVVIWTLTQAAFCAMFFCFMRCKAV